MFPCGNAFRHNAAASVFSEMNHFGAGIGLLVVIGNGYRIELANDIIARQNATRISLEPFLRKYRNWKLHTRLLPERGF